MQVHAHMHACMHPEDITNSLNRKLLQSLIAQKLITNDRYWKIKSGLAA